MNVFTRMFRLQLSAHEEMWGVKIVSVKVECPRCHSTWDYIPDEYLPDEGQENRLYCIPCDEKRMEINKTNTDW